MTLQPIESGLLLAQGYDPDTQTLAVQFQSNPTWTYFSSGVPAEVYQAFLADPHPGTYYIRNIKKRYAERKEPS